MTNDALDAPPPLAPTFGAPAVIWILCAVITAVSVAVLIGPPELAAWLFAAAAVAAGEAGADAPRPLGPVAPYVLHALVHGGWAHLVMNVTALFAFGTLLARRWSRPGLGPLALLALFCAAAAAGAAWETLTAPPEGVVLVGASGGVFGLIAGAVAIYRGAPGRPAPVWSAAYWTGLAPWIGLNLLIALLGPISGPLLGSGGIAWGAHLAGLAIGIVGFALLDPVARRRA